MTTCGTCHAEMAAGNEFCSHCGTRADAASDAAEPAVNYVDCGSCHERVEEGMSYCNHCGAELAAVGFTAAATPEAAPAAVPDASRGVAPAPCPPDNGEERELFRKSASYMKDFLMKGVAGSAGTLIITTRRIVFEPSKVNLASLVSLFSGNAAKNIEIGMDEVTGASQTTILAMNIGLEIVTPNLTHTFSMGLTGGGEAARAAQLINEYKTG